MTQRNASDMFTNAVKSIKMGIEDYAVDTPSRALSAVRNFYAGVLLLGKEVLIRKVPLADPDEVIGARYMPVPNDQGGVEHVNEGGQTINFHTLGKRFKAFKIPIDTRELEELNDLRNNIEHRFTDQPAQAVREAIARAFPITVAMFHQAGEHPADVLGDAWQSMLEVRALHKKELARCRSSLAGVDWVSPTVANEHLRCTECGSDLIEQRDAENPNQEAMDLICRNCGAEPGWDEAIVDAVDRALGGEAYIRAKETGEPGPIYDCPSCDRHAYIDEEEACAVCGETFEYEHECARCHGGIPLEDALVGFNEGLCSYCTYIANKDD
ncbi:hypothetical protein [Mangrovibrevibacter kandeliae]|uniref:hypothetical protein n=1 Tax=Mangrovibrevibacter kandeliae TaxID=2968473 RepID=UPI002117CCDB|nr:hypothetical protein [Aurantimonas sp. CSK15Z-1]MCQ8782910.1 hypothetical protein [Aurantimonas sp. CSK15Z-1]